MTSPRLARRASHLLLALAALSLVAGALARPLASLASSRLAVSLACPVSDWDLLFGREWRGDERATSDVLHADLTDPWGRPWRLEHGPADGPGTQPWRLYSVGPDGRDDRTGGDDVVVRAGSVDLVLLRDAPLVGACAAALLLWAWLALRLSLAPRAEHAAADAGRALLIVSLPIVIVTGLALHHAQDLRALEGVVDAQRLFVPAPVAVSTTTAFLLWLAALFFRRRRPAQDPEQRSDGRSRLRATAARALVALVVLGATFAWGLQERAARERRTLLARACLPSMSAHGLLFSRDVGLLRSFARGAPPWVSFTGLDDASYHALATLGPDANALMTRALADRPGSSVQRGQASTPWEHLRTHDPHLDTLMAAIAARPHAYEGFLLDHAALAAGRIGRRAVGGVLVRLLDDTSSAGSSFNGYGVRVCDHALEALVGLFPEAALDKPAWNEQTGARWDEAIAAARRWAAAELTTTAPARIVVLDVRELTLRSGRSNVELRAAEGLFWSSGSDQTRHLLARVVTSTDALRAVDTSNGRPVDVPLSIEPGQTAWVELDMAAGTATTTVYTPPP